MWAQFCSPAALSQRIPEQGLAALSFLSKHASGATSKKAPLALKGRPCSSPPRSRRRQGRSAPKLGILLRGPFGSRNGKLWRDLGEEGTGSSEAAGHVCARLLPLQDNFRKPVKATWVFK